MKIRITARTMHGSGTSHTARRCKAGWYVSWLPGRILTEDQALAAMKIAGLARRRRVGPIDDRIAEWAGTLGMPPVCARMSAR